MSLLSLIPTPVLAGAGLVAAAGIFAGGIGLESRLAADTLDKEKLAHVADMKKLGEDWTINLEAMRTKADAAEAELAVEKKANEIARENANVAYQKTVGALKVATDRNNADAVRVRDEYAAAIAAVRPADGSGQAAAASATPGCSGPGGAATCRLLGRAIDLAARCSDAIGQQHAAVILAVDSWPK